MIVSDPPPSMLRAEPKNLLGLCRARRVYTTRQNLSRLRRDGVVRAREPRQRVEQNHHVLAVLDQPLRLLEHHVGDLDVTRRSLIEGGAHHFRARGAGDHLRHFFGPLVDEQHDDRHLRMILRDRVRHLVEQDRLSGARRRNDDSALTLPDRRHEIHDAHAEIAIGRLEAQPLIRILRPEVVERHAVLRLLRIVAVYALDLEQREIPLPRLGWTNLASHIIPSAQPEALDLRRRDVDVVRTRQVAPILAAQKAVALGKNLEYAVAVEHDVGLEKILLDLEDEILLPETRRAVDLEAVGHLLKLGHGFSL